MNEARIIVSGEAFWGGGHRAIDAVMDDLVEGTRSELSIAIYLFTSTRILEDLRGAAYKGVKISILVNDFTGQPLAVQQELRALVARYPSVHVYNFNGGRMGPLHAKVLVSDRSEAIVGSANFTGAAMDKNHEIGLHVKGGLAEELAALLDSLVALSSPI